MARRPLGLRLAERRFRSVIGTIGAVHGQGTETVRGKRTAASFLKRAGALRNSLPISARKESLSGERGGASTQQDSPPIQQDSLPTQRDSLPIQRDSLSTQRDSLSTQRDSLPAARAIRGVPKPDVQHQYLHCAPSRTQATGDRYRLNNRRVMSEEQGSHALKNLYR